MQRYVKYLASAVTPLLALGSTFDLLEPTAENFLMRIDLSITRFLSGKAELQNTLRVFSELHSDADALEILKARDEKCALKENKESEGARERSLSFYQMVWD